MGNDALEGRAVTKDEAAEGRRYNALQMALDAHKGLISMGHTSVADIINAAKTIEAYIAGEAK